MKLLRLKDLDEQSYFLGCLNRSWMKPVIRLDEVQMHLVSLLFWGKLC